MANTSDTDGHIIIRGLTHAGRRFRPSDWAERLSTQSGTFVGGRIRYHPYVQLRTLDGVKSLVVDKRYAVEKPLGFAHLLAFARGNDLVVEGLDEATATAADPAGARRPEPLRVRRAGT
ncbi:DUF3579 domain-containing protein [Ectothiorhodospiraceae bacterium 2226]|nr:DUF3579 domain-containing protein [Ectothiorhodospiraceae bacterium 2226]